MSAFHEHVESLRKTLQLTPVDVSKRMGRSDSYYRKMLEQESVPRGDNLQRLAAALETTIEGLAQNSDPGTRGAILAAVSAQPVREVSDPIPIPNIRDLPRDVPVLGTASGSVLGGRKGAMQLTSDIIDYVRRPPGLATTTDAYALYIENTSMVPKFEPGDLIYVNPSRPSRPGDHVVIQVRNSEHAETETYIKKLLRRSASELLCEQYNPHSEIRFKSDRIIVHRVMTTSEMMSL